MNLNSDQLKALELLNSTENCFITGKGGCGKTFLISYFQSQLTKKIPVTTSTGAAAIIAGNDAVTASSFFGLGLIDSGMNIEDIIKKAMRPNVIKRIKKADAVIIDEVSMISGFQFECIVAITKEIRKNMKPMRFILTGDFYQLPPVSKTNSKTSDWIFKSKAWSELNIKSYELTEVMRTKNEEFLTVLNSVRAGNCTPSDIEFFKRHRYQGQEIEATRIFPKVAQVDAYNEENLNSLPGDLVEIPTVFSGDSKAIEQLKKNMPIPVVLRLKIGAYVMIRKNNIFDGYVNGSTGTILEMTETAITIKLTTGKTVIIGKSVFSQNDGDGNQISSGTNFALTLASAISSHKSQGLSLSRAIVDISNLFAAGQAYVILSRLSNPDELYISGFDRKSIFTDPEVKEFYKKIA